MASETPMNTTVIARITEFFRTIHDYMLSGVRRKVEPVKDPASLRRFLETRSSYIAQTSLYGYLRTRAGMRYPELFDDDVFVVSINAAKWHMWLACLSDLSVYAGGLLSRRAPGSPVDVGGFMQGLVGTILEDTGVPEDADTEFPAHAERVLIRLRQCDWMEAGEGEESFTQSPSALVRYAPIVEELKQLDDEIVRNSVRFHWQEVRRDLREHLDADAVLAAIGDTAANR